MRITLGVLTTAAVLLLAAPSGATAQEPRLVGRLPEPARAQIDEILDAARADGLPTEPLVDRALEGSAKGAPPALIVSAVTRLRDELDRARGAFGASASPAELTAGASALRAGATVEHLAELRRLRPEQPLTVAVAVLADLVAGGVPLDTAVTAVMALATDARDADYVAFRRNVQRDIALGASPAAALGVRLRAVTTLADDGTTGLQDRPGGPGKPQKRKP